MNILVIEDDAEIRSDIEVAAQELNLMVSSVANLSDALAFLRYNEPAIVIADRMLPDGDGLDAVELLREANASALIMVISALGRSQNRIEGFNKGADDYLTKPFDPIELRARMASLKRRAELVHTHDEVLTIHDMEIRRKARTVHRDQQHIALSPKEFDLLIYLAENRGQLVTRSMLLENVWGLHFNPQTNVVDVHIGRLRQKIDAPFAVPILQTIRGKGYVLEATKTDATESV